MSVAGRENFTDRLLEFELMRATEAAALAASRHMGRGDQIAADQAAVDAMRRSLETAPLHGTVAIGEGEKDEAPMLYIGERVGQGGPKVDIAVDPLEGTALTARGAPNALTVLAMTDAGGFLHAPDVYMEKIAVGPGLPDGVVDLDASVDQNLRSLAKAKNRDVSSLTVCVLDRPRHVELIKQIRSIGARAVLISDGDISGVISVSLPSSDVDMYMGIGGAPEGVLAAAALRCIGGRFQGRLCLDSEEKIRRASAMGIADTTRKYSLEELAHGDVVFAATGVTDGALLRGVHFHTRGALTYSVIFRSRSGTVRYIKARHNFSRKTWL